MNNLKPESITGLPASKLVIMRKLLGSFWTIVFDMTLEIVFVWRTEVFAKTILEHYLQWMFTKTVGVLRSGFTVSNIPARIRMIKLICRRRNMSHLFKCVIGRFSGSRWIDDDIHDSLPWHRGAQLGWDGLDQHGPHIRVQVDDLGVTSPKTTPALN